MSGKPRNPEDELRNVCDAMAESVANMTEDEALAEARAEGIDTKAEANRLRALALGVAKNVRLSALRQAKERHERERVALTSKTVRLPDTPQARRALLARTLDQHPELTAAARDLKDVPDDDVETQLRDLAALGALDDVKE